MRTIAVGCPTNRLAFRTGGSQAAPEGEHLGHYGAIRTILPTDGMSSTIANRM